MTTKEQEGEPWRWRKQCQKKERKSFAKETDWRSSERQENLQFHFTQMSALLTSSKLNFRRHFLRWLPQIIWSWLLFGRSFQLGKVYTRYNYETDRVMDSLLDIWYLEESFHLIWRTGTKEFSSDKTNNPTITLYFKYQSLYAFRMNHTLYCCIVEPKEPFREPFTGTFSSQCPM